jgi:phosphatidylserine decarboxylase
MDILIVALLVILGILLVLFLFWRLWFLRLPKRKIPKKGIVSPASGKLVRIIPFKGAAVNVPKGLLGMVRAITKDVAKEGHLLLVMLTPMDVHYQRSPVAGVVEKISYSKGKFNNAVFGAGELKAFENEKNEILIRTGKEKIKVIQVAGVAARRIVCNVKKGQKLQKGDVIGLINLGSQVILIIPKKKLLVKEGEYMTDGETVIA